MRAGMAVAVALTSLLCCPAKAAGETYPERPVRIIMPGGAGSGADIAGRTVAAGLTAILGQQVIVDNRPGAAGNIGAEIASRATPDGYTLFHVNITHALNASLYRNLTYDLLRDFTPITQTATAPGIVVVHPSLPVHSISDLVRLAKAKPGEIDYASAGSGTSTFLAAELFNARAGTKLVHVPYKGGGEAQRSIVSGETSVYFASIGTVLPHIRNARVRAIAVTSEKRLAALPEYPTVAESGYPGFQSSNWYGLMAPSKTSRQIVDRIRAATVASLQVQSVHKRLDELVYVPIGDRPEEFRKFIASEVAGLAKLVNTLGLKSN